LASDYSSDGSITKNEYGHAASQTSSLASSWPMQSSALPQPLLPPQATVENVMFRRWMIARKSKREAGLEAPEEKSAARSVSKPNGASNKPVCKKIGDPKGAKPRWV